MEFQSKKYYIPIPFILLVGYFIGIFYPIVIYYHDWWADFLIGGSKIYAIAFLLGILGATTQMSIGFAREINVLVLKPDEAILPSYYEPFGYILKQIWGGITAVIFILAVKQGFLAAFKSSQTPMELGAIIVIAFVVGLRAFGILKSISGIIKLAPPISHSKLKPVSKDIPKKEETYTKQEPTE